MKRFLHDILIILILAMLILLSYSLIEKHLKPHIPEGIYQNLIRHLKPGEKKHGQANDSYHGVWLSYIEFESYLDSTEENNSKTFSDFYQHILDRCKRLGIDHIIVQVRPFGDALYDSEYYPWSDCISGQRGKSPGYDPLKIMVKLTHKNGMKIEAWINPFRISTDNNLQKLSEDNPARIWRQDPATSRNVLEYDGALYYNPAKEKVRDMIINGVDEIVAGYDVDGIHMDDYFYPEFDTDDYLTAFDAPEYKADLEAGTVSEDMSLPEWRRQNTNMLVSDIYAAIKERKSRVTFGISPAGDPENLRSDCGYYSDIDTWVSQEGYIDYIMPQIYWGYTHELTPFNTILEEWKEICKGSPVTLYAGLQLYRLGINDHTVSDYEELQSSNVIIQQLKQVKKDPDVKGFSLFSYQYLDADNKKYMFESSWYSKRRKKILRDVVDYLHK